jgi:hypothetical protein
VLASAVLDTVIGVSFVFFLVALASSAIVEWVANLTRKRAKYLLRGVQAMLVDRPVARTSWSPAGIWTAMRAEQTLYRDVMHRTVGAAERSKLVKVMDHPLLRARRQTDPDGRYTRLPPYLPAADVATALVDELLDSPLPDQFAERIAAIGGSLGRSLSALWERAAADPQQFLVEVAGWYDAQMERVSGWYKRWTKRWIIAVGLLIAVLVGVNTVRIAESLYGSDTVREAVSAAATGPGLCGDPAAGTDQSVTEGPAARTALCVQDTLRGLDVAGLPLGWPTGCPADPAACARPALSDPGAPVGVLDWLVTLLGIALTTGAAALGAPFWFDAIGRLSSLRSTGTRPVEAASTTPPARA